MSDSIFMKIIRREIPAEIVYEDDGVIAFLDINPAVYGHTLVVPKNYSENYMEATSDDLVNCMKVAQIIGKSLMALPNVTGIKLISNAGVSAGQSVSHTHIHVIPCSNEEFLPSWDHKKYQGSLLNEFGEKIRKSLIPVSKDNT